MTLAPETRLGPYDILSKLGHGGMGIVYTARDPRLGPLRSDPRFQALLRRMNFPSTGT